MADLIPLDSHIHRAPPGHKLVSRIPVMPLPPVEPTVREMIDMKHKEPDYYWEKVNGACERVVGAMKAKLGDRVPDHVFELYGDLIGGPFRLDRDTFIREGTSSGNTREQLPRIQHNLVHNLFYAGLEGADPTFSGNIYQILKMHHDLLKSPHISNPVLRKFWSGVKSELAVIKVLAEHGHTVVLPNYAEELNDDGMSQDVLASDVGFGIDIFTAKHGQAYGIDVKGRREDEGGALRRHISIHADSDRRPKQLQWDRLPDRTKGLIDFYSPGRDWRKGTVIIPTSSEHLRGFREMPAGSSPKAELQRFATFTERGLSNDLIQGIMRLQAF